MDTDTLDGFSPEEAAASSTNSLWSNVEGMGHAVAGAWDVMNGSFNHALSSGLRLIGDNEDADMSDRFMEQRWQSATEHFQQMHRDFDGTSAAATDSLDAQNEGDQDDWPADGAPNDGDTDSSFDDSEADDSDDYSQDSPDASPDGDTGDDGDDGDL